MPAPTVAVIGAGFSGALAAVHLLRQQPRPRVVLVERDAAFARGVAYGPASGGCLLNVRAGNMSAFPTDPDHFVRWLRDSGRHGEADGAAFVRRTIYGEYLGEVLRDAGARCDGALTLRRAEAVHCEPDAADRFRVRLADGAVLQADAVILALGQLPPEDPLPPRAEPGHARYVADPWRPYALAGIGSGERVLLLGAGLTMVDVALGLSREVRRAPLLAISRRGLLPHRHGAPPATGAAEPPATAATLSRSLRAFRRAAARDDWRRAIDSLRPLTQAVWMRLDPAEQRRFLRHLRPYWDIHRHRLAPVVADQLDTLIRSGGLEVAAGRLVELRPSGEGLRAILRMRGADASREEHVDWVVNCTGPGGDLARVRDRLVRSLVAAGRLTPDPLRLGVLVDADCRTIGRDERADGRLLAIGPATRGVFWESSAVPDLRVQVAHAVSSLAARLRYIQSNNLNAFETRSLI